MGNAQEEGQKFKNQLIVGQPQGGVNVDAIVEQIVHHGNDAEDPGTADIFVIDLGNAGGQIPQGNVCHNNHDKKPDNVLHGIVLENGIYKHSHPVCRLAAQIGRSDSRKDGGKMLPVIQADQQDDRRVGEQRIKKLGKVFTQRQKRGELQQTAEHKQSQTNQKILFRGMDAGESSRQNNAEGQKHAVIQIKCNGTNQNSSPAFPKKVLK